MPQYLLALLFNRAVFVGVICFMIGVAVTHYFSTIPINIKHEAEFAKLQSKYDKKLGDIAALSSKMEFDINERMRNAQKTHAENERIIDKLRNTVNGMRLKLPARGFINACGTEAEDNSDGGGGLLLQRTNEALGKFQDGFTERIVARCERLNNDAIESNLTINTTN